MTAAQLLAKHGLTVEQAREWIFQNIDNPALIYQTAMEVGCNSTMLAEIVSPNIPGVNASMVESFFSGHGLNGWSLATVTPPADNGGAQQLIPQELDSLAALVGFNNETGILSTASLRAAVQAQTGVTPYNNAFSPTLYQQETSGRFEIDGFGVFDATTDNLQSVYYGTLIRTFRAIDSQELDQLASFASLNLAALEAGNTAVIDAFFALVVGVFEDAAVQPAFSNSDIASQIVQGTVEYVRLLGTGSDAALFDSLLLTWT